MIHHHEITSGLGKRIRLGQIQFAGNARLKIYGLLSCSSGKRMNKLNRVFFKTEQEANELGFRPCGHCLKTEYTHWKSTQEAG